MNKLALENMPLEELLALQLDLPQIIQKKLTKEVQHYNATMQQGLEELKMIDNFDIAKYQLAVNYFDEKHKQAIKYFPLEDIFYFELEEKGEFEF